MVRFRAPDYVVLVVEDLDRALLFYCDMLGLPLGLFCSYWLSGKIAHSYGWRAAFYLPCLPGLVLGVLSLKIREPHRGAAEAYAQSSRRRPE